jgi:hypothetical protein
MEYSTISTDLKSSEIKPEQSLNQYISLVEKEAAQFFPAQDLVFSHCPACQSQKTKETFQKMQFNYSTCADCWTTYASKRPTQKALNHFYTESQARRFWIDHIWKDSESSRVQKILSPIIDWVSGFIKPQSAVAAEILPNNPGFSKAWLHESKNLFLVEPTFPHSNTSNTLDFDTNKTFGALFFFETLDRVESPRKILAWAREHLEIGGYCFVTGILSTGFDSLVLGANSRALLPPDRLTSFSLEGVLKLAQDFDFEVVELSTPGVLDLDNIKNGLDKTSSRLFEYLLKVRPEEPLRENFQRFLQENQLSSRARIVLKKRK